MSKHETGTVTKQTTCARGGPGERVPPPGTTAVSKHEIGTVDVPVYRPPVYRFALFTGVFFSCHPVTPVYRWYAGIPGWFIFSCSRSPSCCCTQHNTTRWVLRAAANTCLHTMLCAAGELCQLSDSTTTPEFQSSALLLVHLKHCCCRN